MPEPLALAFQAERYSVNDKLLAEVFGFNLVLKSHDVGCISSEESNVCSLMLIFWRCSLRCAEDV